MTRLNSTGEENGPTAQCMRLLKNWIHWTHGTGRSTKGRSKSVIMASAMGVTAFLLLVLHCADGSSTNATTSVQTTPAVGQNPSAQQEKTSPPKFSARIPSSTVAAGATTKSVQQQQTTYKRSASPFPFPFPSSSPTQSKSRPRDRFDFSHGFPEGFTQGLPKFDFSRPMDAKTDNEHGEPIGEDTNNVGFVHGPPKGFPTLKQLGGDFPSFQSSNNGDDRHTSKSPQIQYPQIPQGQGSRMKPFKPTSGYKSQPKKPHPDNDDDYLSGPGPAAPVSIRRPPPPPPPVKPGYKRGVMRGTVIGLAHKPHHHEKYPALPVPLVGRPHETSGNSVLKYLPSITRKPAASSNAPFLKLGQRKFKPSQLLPPLFYASSPDILATSSQRVNTYTAVQPRQQAERLLRLSRSASDNLNSQDEAKAAVTTSANTKEGEKTDDLLADGSEQGSYWQLAPSQYIMFDTYDRHHAATSGAAALQERADLISARRENSSEHDDAVSGEQRFFPSFPAPAPYLGLGGIPPPFGLPPPVARPPVFPGPAANRAPSRYYPQFGPSKYTSALGPPPNRGPSNVFSSAESHDHYQDNNLLGSGNFEVVRGGTYYQEDDALDYYHHHGHGHDHDGDYYQHHNGHAAPHHGYRLPGQDFFANFRDFADINPPARSFSHHHVTSVDPNSSASNKQPKNILEKLQSTSESVVPAGHHEFSSSSEQDPMIATF